MKSNYELITDQDRKAIKDRIELLIEIENRKEILEWIDKGNNPKEFIKFKKKDLFLQLKLESLYFYSSSVTGGSKRTIYKTGQFKKLWNGLGL